MAIRINTHSDSAGLSKFEWHLQILLPMRHFFDIPENALNGLVSAYSNVPPAQAPDVLHIFKHVVSGYVLKYILNKKLDLIQDLFLMKCSTQTMHLEDQMATAISSEIARNIDLDSEESMALSRLLISYWKFHLRSFVSTTPVEKRLGSSVA